MLVYLGEMVKEPICLFIYHWPALAGETDKEPVRLFAPAMLVTTKISMHWKSSELTIQFGDPALLEPFGLRRSQEFELTSFHSVVSGDGIQR